MTKDIYDEDSVNIEDIISRMTPTHGSLYIALEAAKLLKEENILLRQALAPFAAIKPVVLSENPETHAKHYWTVIGHPGKSHFTEEDLVLARKAMEWKNGSA